jgi:hemolysin activation/secretion protein
MFGTEQFSVGGYHSVRGFRENYITGDSGYYIRNKAQVNLASLVVPFLTKKNNEEKNGFFRKNLVHLSKVSLEPFYDFGYVKNKYAFNGGDGRLSGAGIKTIFKHKYFDASLTYGWALNKSQLITSEDKENKILYFELSAKCC